MKVCTSVKPPARGKTCWGTQKQFETGKQKEEFSKSRAEKNYLDLLLCLLSAAVVFYVDCCRDPTDDKGHPTADQIKPVGGLDKGTVDFIAFEKRRDEDLLANPDLDYNVWQPCQNTEKKKKER